MQSSLIQSTLAQGAIIFGVGVFVGGVVFIGAEGVGLDGMLSELGLKSALGNAQSSPLVWALLGAGALYVIGKPILQLFREKEIVFKVKGKDVETPPEA